MNKGYTLITGATSGIGYELAKLYASDGYNLILVSRNVERLKTVEKKLQLYNVDIKILSVDLSNDNSANDIVSFVNKENLSINILINNAGIGSFGYFNEIDEKREIELIHININALTKLTKYFLPQMIKKNHGGIMNVASTAAFCAGPKMATYYASKAYVLNLTEAISEEVNGSGVKVSCLCPGPVKTDFQGKAGIKKSEKAKKYLMEANEVANIAYKEFNRGKVIIIPGFKNKLLVISTKLLPRSISRKIVLKTNIK